MFIFNLKYESYRVNVDATCQTGKYNLNNPFVNGQQNLIKPGIRKKNN